MVLFVILKSIYNFSHVNEPIIPHLQLAGFQVLIIKNQKKISKIRSFFPDSRHVFIQLVIFFLGFYRVNIVSGDLKVKTRSEDVIYLV